MPAAPISQGYGLALHTTSPQLGLAIAPLNPLRQDSRTQTWDLGRALSAELHSRLSDFIRPLGWADLSFLAVTKGPGGFTGTRIGVVAARTLAQQLKLPLFAISTLAATAGFHRQEGGDRLLAVQMSASRGQIFGGVYRVSEEGRLAVVRSDSAISPDSWKQLLAELDAEYQLIIAPENLGITASSLLELAQQEWYQGKRPHWSKALPYYGQHPVQ